MQEEDENTLRPSNTQLTEFLSFSCFARDWRGLALSLPWFKAKHHSVGSDNFD